MNIYIYIYIYVSIEGYVGVLGGREGDDVLVINV